MQRHNCIKIHFLKALLSSWLKNGYEQIFDFSSILI